MVTKRLIHVRAGRWKPPLPVAALPSAHPRARGAMDAARVLEEPRFGSSTCARGDGTSRPCAHRRRGLIHVRAGRWYALGPLLDAVVAHPRARGAMVGNGRRERVWRGSSTCARGDGSPRGLYTSTFPAHPRARGAMVSCMDGRSRSSGSSTCARGDGRPTQYSVSLPRLIHVRAGRWRPRHCVTRSSAAHPRARGAMALLGPLPGRPTAHPRARGAMAGGAHRAARHRRLIHVRAGRWDPLSMSLLDLAAHPRARGAMVQELGEPPREDGSSTCARGDGERDLLRRWGIKAHPRARGAMGKGG